MTIGVTEARMALLRSLPLFEGVGEEELQVVAALLDDIEIEAGEVLTTEGRIGCEAFVIVGGAAEVWVEGRHVATLERGALIGEKAVLDRRPHDATVRATTPMTLLVAGSDELSTLAGLRTLGLTTKGRS
jgi:CRP-like cAMP-binding protein